MSHRPQAITPQDIAEATQMNSPEPLRRRRRETGALGSAHRLKSGFCDVTA